MFGPRKDENRRSGRPRQTTAGQDRRLRLLAVRDRFSTTRSIADQWFGEEGKRITTRTIYRRIRSFGLMSYRPHSQNATVRVVPRKVTVE
jgi:transposase